MALENKKVEENMGNDELAGAKKELQEAKAKVMELEASIDNVTKSYIQRGEEVSRMMTTISRLEGALYNTNKLLQEYQKKYPDANIQLPQQ